MEKNKYMRLLISIPVLMFWLLFSNDAFAADAFTHNHSDNCYVTNQVPCLSTEHNRMHSLIATVHDCPTCSNMTSQTFHLSTEYCTNTKQTSEHGGYYVCNVCGKTGYSYGIFNYVWQHTHPVTSLNCGLNQGDVTATVSLENSQTQWSNQGITLCINVNSVSTLFSAEGIQYSFDGGNQWGNNNSTIIGENGTYTGMVRDGEGNIVSKSISVTNIDKNVPEIYRILPEKNPWYDGTQIIKVEASDAESGLDGNGYSFDGGSTWQGEDRFETGQEGTFKIKVRDKAGNISESEIILTKTPVIEQTAAISTGTEAKNVDNGLIGTRTSTGEKNSTSNKGTANEKTVTNKKADANGKEASTNGTVGGTKGMTTVSNVNWLEGQRIKEEIAREKARNELYGFQLEEQVADVTGGLTQEQVADVSGGLTQEQAERSDVTDGFSESQIIVETKQVEAQSLPASNIEESQVKALSQNQYKPVFFVFLLLGLLTTMFLFWMFLLRIEESGLLYEKNNQGKFRCVSRLMVVKENNAWFVQIPPGLLEKHRCFSFCFKPSSFLRKKNQGKRIEIQYGKEKVSGEMEKCIYFQTL